MINSAIPRAIAIRLFSGIPVFLLVTFASTALLNLIPSSPAQLILGDYATPQQIAEFNQRAGYDRPVLERYLDWLGGALHGDFGMTLFSHQPVAPLLMERAAVTFEIALLSLLLSLLVALPLAMYAASRPDRLLDTLLRALTSAMLSIPSFVTVVLLAYVFATVLRWLPATGWVAPWQSPLANLYYVALPVLCLSVHQAAYFYRISRNELVSILQEDYIVVARAKGLPLAYIMLRHAMRPALPQIVTVIGLSLTFLLGGSFIVESYFAVPGIGWTVLDSVKNHDFPMMQAILSLTVLIFVVIFILVDIAYAVIDPRVRLL